MLGLVVVLVGLLEEAAGSAGAAGEGKRGGREGKEEDERGLVGRDFVVGEC
jgi:hypothetical protein